MTVYFFGRLMIRPTLPNRIKEFRSLKRWKQSVLARRVGILQSEISEIETGTRKPNVYLARKIARALGKSVDEVFSPCNPNSYNYGQEKTRKVNL